MNKVELLSPCGNFDCLVAAVCAGADAVYLSGQMFGARAYAGNFSDEELLEAISYAHFWNVKVYLTVNTLMKDSEVDMLFAYLAPLYRAGLDAVIVQDLGVLTYIHECFPNLSIHISTQMSVTDSSSALLLKNAGAVRIVPARELSLSEIKEMIAATDMPMECFIHGAMCYSYSGKCLLSSFLGGRSGNRGRCAQPCRLPYNGEYLLSMKDMSTLSILPDLIDAGIASFKIEGRMKSPEYVYRVTSVYRRAIDNYLAGRGMDDAQLNDELLSQYTRGGNCTGYYYEHNGKDMITHSLPGYSSAKDELSDYEIVDKKCVVNMHFKMYIGQPMELTLQIASSDCHFHNTEVSQKGEIAQCAVNKPLSEEDIQKQLLKLNNTYYKAGHITIDTDLASFVPVSQINSLRRETIDLLTREVNKAYVRNDKPQKPLLPPIGKKDFFEDKKSFYDRPQRIVSVMTLSQLHILNSYDFDGVILPDYMFEQSDQNHNAECLKILDSLIKRGKKIYLHLAYVTRKMNAHSRAFMMLFDYPEITGVYISNLESLYLLQQEAYQGEIIADFHLYAMNKRAVCFLKKQGVHYTTVPLELNRKELIERDVKGEDLIVYGKLPMMVSAQCIHASSREGCIKKSGATNRFDRIIDRKLVAFPYINMCSACTNVIFNSVPLSLHKDIDLIGHLSARSIRICLTDENDNETNKVLSFFLGDSEEFPFNEFTRGHLQRGVL